MQSNEDVDPLALKHGIPSSFLAGEGVDDEEEEESKPAFYSAAIYLVNRAYGGPEEGGWWFNEAQNNDGDVLIQAWGDNVTLRFQYTLFAGTGF